MSVEVRWNGAVMILIWRLFLTLEGRFASFAMDERYLLRAARQARPQVQTTGNKYCVPGTHYVLYVGGNRERIIPNRLLQ